MRSVLLFCLFILCCIGAHAQGRQQDVQLITGFQISQDLPRGFDVSVQYQFRAYKYLRVIRGSYFYGSVRYTLIKKVLSAELEYRYMTSEVKDQHRFGLGIIAKHKIGEFTFSDRLVYQREHPYFNSSYENGNRPTNTIRNRVQVKWDFKKRWDAYVSCEPFIRISNEIRQIKRVRAIAGMDWEFKKNHNVNLFYQYQTQVNQKEPSMMHTIGCMYEWDLPKIKKKKKKE